MWSTGASYNTHNVGTKSAKNHQEMKLDNKIERETANPFKMLSAY